MKISKNGQYALLSVADLAIHTADGHESLAHIAQRQDIEPRYLGQIFFALKNAGLVKGVRGKTGGYYLTRPAEELTAGEVVRAVEGDLAPTQCCLGDEASRDCKTYKGCITRTLWRKIAQEINDTLDRITIADIISEYNKETKSDDAQ